MDTVEQYRLTRNRGVPLVAITTPDPSATVARLVAGSLNGEAETTPIVRWSIASGFYGHNEAGRKAIAAIVSSHPEGVTDPLGALVLAQDLPLGSILFTETLHAAIGEPGLAGVACAQAARELRDPFKRVPEGAPKGTRCRQLVMLCPAITLPDLLRDDVWVIEEPRPGREELAGIAGRVHQAAGLRAPAGADAMRVVDALAGLSAFPAEQAVAMSLRQDGCHQATLEQRKRQMINATDGLTVCDERLSFADLAGVAEAKRELSRLVELDAFDCILSLEELDKAMAGSFASHVGDSGVGKDFLGQVLTWMQERKNRSALIGMIFLGPPGTAKSALAVAAGNEAGRPVIRMDPGGMRGGIVGESERMVRRALATVDAISERRVLLIATCNAIGGVDSALVSRFAKRYYFDLPTEAEAAGIWQIKRAKYGIPDADPTPAWTQGWTGREMQDCCEWAALTQEPLELAAAGIVPVAVTARDEIEALRAQADGRLLSASYPGLYHRSRPEAAGARGISLE